MISDTERRRYEITRDLPPQEWVDWECRMIDLGFIVARLDTEAAIDGIYAGRGDFARAVPELGMVPRSQAAEKSWQSVGGIVARATWNRDETMVRPGDVVERDDLGNRTHRFYSIELLERLSEGGKNAPMMSVTGVGIGSVKFLVGLVRLAGENPDFFADSTQKVVEALQARAAVALNPVV